MRDSDTAVLDDPVGYSLHYRHSRLARRFSRTATYESGVATFASVPATPTTEDWDDLARLLGSGQLADRLRPPGWTEISSVCTAPHAAVADSPRT